MAYAQGSVVLAPATFKSGVRPYLVVSNRNRPFFGDRYTVAVITSTERQAAVELDAASLSEGELKTYPSYSSGKAKAHGFSRGMKPTAAKDSICCYVLVRVPRRGQGSQTRCPRREPHWVGSEPNHHEFGTPSSRGPTRSVAV